MGIGIGLGSGLGSGLGLGLGLGSNLRPLRAVAAEVRGMALPDAPVLDARPTRLRHVDELEGRGALAQVLRAVHAQPLAVLLEDEVAHLARVRVKGSGVRA